MVGCGGRLLGLFGEAGAVRGLLVVCCVGPVAHGLQAWGR